ncbi:HD domain-containing protein [Ktedonosporobacter rubrisoli]|uniref:HD domain-containing protein n=1 Tax=Ktedonosporobacter rubrisoli TaxID=2509675 RepID=A0A4P6JV12_KTERU|nr:HD domain-containing protein [Ktedonosporobacter rubrisoli]QBD79235.1 HD domain-containing protein [Ktedonosporobacter rubrisoli]
MELPFSLETALEKTIAADPEWQKGVVWGKPRAGHLEGAIKFHIADVLANLDQQCLTAEERRDLRLIALIHDTFKYRVDESKPKMGTNHHAYIARKFAERYIHNPMLLELIQLHDEAYNSWRLGAFKDRWDLAEERIDNLLEQIGSALPLYVHFFLADSATSSKNPAPVLWFEHLLERKGYTLPSC